jgi:ferredoxin
MLPRRLPMQVRVDEERCQGHGLCRLSAPDIFFAREEDGHAYVLSETVPEGREDEAQLAADSCPELAIEVE